jgi:hypothetical protein
MGASPKSKREAPPRRLEDYVLTYEVGPQEGLYPVGNSVMQYVSGSAGDGGAESVKSFMDIGFDFVFNGNTYNRMCVGSNGHVVLLDPNGVEANVYDDILTNPASPGSNSGLKTTFTGGGSNHVLVAGWWGPTRNAFRTPSDATADQYLLNVGLSEERLTSGKTPIPTGIDASLGGVKYYRGRSDPRGQFVVLRWKVFGYYDVYDPPSPPVSRTLETQDFDTTSVGSLPSGWSTSGDAAWVVSTTDYFTSPKSAQAGAVAGNNALFTRLIHDVTSSTYSSQVMFRWRTTVANDDLRFYIDNIQQGLIVNNSSGWVPFTSSIMSPGSHRLVWRYTNSSNSDRNTGWVDNFKFVIPDSVPLPEPPSNDVPLNVSTFDVVLYESGDIELRYSPGVFERFDSRETATIGVFGNNTTYRDFGYVLKRDSVNDRGVYQNGGAVWNSLFTDPATGGAYTTSLNMFQYWPGRAQFGATFHLSPPRNRRRNKRTITTLRDSVDFVNKDSSFFDDRSAVPIGVQNIEYPSMLPTTFKYDNSRVDSVAAQELYQSGSITVNRSITHGLFDSALSDSIIEGKFRRGR